MSQMSGLAGGEPKVSNTSRAVLLLAIAVVLFIVLLHELDNSPSLAVAEKVKTTKPVQQAVAPTTSTTLTARTPAEVKVLVANGVGVSGAASKVAARLQPIGYQLAKPGNTTDKEVNSVVEYTPGYQAEAQAVATSLGMAASAVQPLPNPAPITDLQSANVVVVVGNDLANSASGTTTTTAGSTGSTGSTTLQTTASGALNGPLTSASSTTVTTTSFANH